MKSNNDEGIISGSTAVPSESSAATAATTDTVRMRARSIENVFEFHEESNC
jgi:hypothetical protein